MASKEQILRALVGESGPMNLSVMGKKLGLPTSNFKSQLNGCERSGLVEKNEQNEYTLTEAGHQLLLAAPPEETPPGGDEEAKESTEESLKTTEYQQFITFGKQTGVVPYALIEQTATHIFSGGDFKDLNWVWQGISEMGIRPDLARRWFHSWRSALHQPIPRGLADEARVVKTEEEVAIKGGKGKRDYILSANDTPIQVGEDVGDLDYEDAVRLSSVRAAAQARGGIQAGPGGQPSTPGTMADEITKVFNAFTAMMGPQTKGKSYVVKPGEDGLYEIEEVNEGKPTIINAPGKGNTNPPSSWLVTPEGDVQEVTSGKPVVIKQAAAPQSQPAKTYLLRQTADGYATEEVEPGKPIIINSPPPASAGMSMIPFPVIGSDGQPVTDSEGKPVYANIEPMIKWLGFQADQRRADERHQMAMSLGQVVRENVADGVAALRQAAADAKGDTSKTTTSKATAAMPTFRCGECQAEFQAPPGWTDQSIKCPGCGREYTKEELLA